jgi:hypothetical protein
MLNSFYLTGMTVGSALAPPIDPDGSGARSLLASWYSTPLPPIYSS